MKGRIADLVRCCGLVATLTIAQSAQAQNPPPSQAELAAIREALQLEPDAEPATLRFFAGRDGGIVMLAPRSIANNLCLQESQMFVGDSQAGYSPFGPRSRTLWSHSDTGQCDGADPDVAPKERTQVTAAVPLAQAIDIVSRTEEFLAVVREFPKSVDSFSERFLNELWVEPIYISRIAHRSAIVPAEAGALSADLPTREGIGGVAVWFDVIDGSFRINSAGQYAEPQAMGFEEEVWQL